MNDGPVYVVYHRVISYGCVACIIQFDPDVIVRKFVVFDSTVAGILHEYSGVPAVYAGMTYVQTGYVRPVCRDLQNCIRPEAVYDGVRTSVPPDRKGFIHQQCLVISAVIHQYGIPGIGRVYGGLYGGVILSPVVIHYDICPVGVADGTASVQKRDPYHGETVAQDKKNKQKINHSFTRYHTIPLVVNTYTA